MRRTVTPEQFTTALQQAAGSNLEAAVLFGSTVAGDALTPRPSHNLLLVLQRLDRQDLDSLGPAVRRWVRAGQPAPLLFTAEGLRRSAEVFPLEMADLLTSRRVLLGRDPVAGLAPSPRHLQYQLEHELKALLIRLRQRYAAIGGHPPLVRRLLTESLSTFLVLCRGALRLSPSTIPANKVEAFRMLASVWEIDPQPVLAILALRTTRGGAEEIRRLFDGYIATLRAVIRHVDQAPASNGGTNR